MNKSFWDGFNKEAARIPSAGVKKVVKPKVPRGAAVSTDVNTMGAPATSVDMGTKPLTPANMEAPTTSKTKTKTKANPTLAQRAGTAFEKTKQKVEEVTSAPAKYIGKKKTEFQKGREQAMSKEQRKQYQKTQKQSQKPADGNDGGGLSWKTKAALGLGGAGIIGTTAYLSGKATQMGPYETSGQYPSYQR